MSDVQLTATATRRKSAERRKPTHTYGALIIGAGFLGLGTAVKLLEAGVEDFVIVERGDRVGGTWRDNTYPGAAVDIPSMLYSFSFVRNPSWSRLYAPADELREHIEHIVERFDLNRFIRFDTELTGLDFDQRAGVWTAHTRTEDFRARTVVSAAGPLSDSSFPDMRGIESYTGKKIHSSKWDHDYDLTGKRVAVIGTGASAVQLIPELVKTAKNVKVFQRTPGWVLPRANVTVPKPVQELFAKVPATQHVARQALFYTHEAMATALVWDSPATTLVARTAKAYLKHEVKDPWLRRQLTPDFRPGCKRMLVSSDYYRALQEDNCKLITWPIATLSPNGIRTSDGVEHDVDCIVFATGYDVHLDGPPFPVHGIGGRSLNEEWAAGAQAYKSVQAHGYPNLFFTTGPNSGPGHNSLLVYAEGQISYIVAGVRAVLDKDLRYLDVRADVQARYNERLQKRLTRTTWMTGCSSWYLTKDGFNASMYPGFATQYLRQMHDFRLEDYNVAQQVPATPRRAARDTAIA